MALLTEILKQWSYLQEAGVALSPEMEAQFNHYHALLVTWNERLNLTALTGEREVVIKHFLDAISILPALAPQQGEGAALRLIDVGTGGGIPGLPVAIMRPGWEVTLLEATRKKCDFLELVARELGLTNVRVLWGRAEEVGRQAESRDAFDVAMARAVADLPILLELCLPFVRVGGRFVAQKSARTEDEVARSSRALGELGGQLDGVTWLTLPELPDEPRALVVVRKVAPTPDKYPRRPGMPNKRPL